MYTQLPLVSPPVEEVWVQVVEVGTKEEGGTRVSSSSSSSSTVTQIKTVVKRGEVRRGYGCPRGHRDAAECRYR